MIDLPYADAQSHLEDSRLSIGLITSSEIKKKAKWWRHYSEKCYSSVEEYYISAVAYVLKWFPLNEPLIKDSEFIDFNKKEECSQSMILTFVERYPKLLP